MLTFNIKEYLLINRDVRFDHRGKWNTYYEQNRIFAFKRSKLYMNCIETDLRLTNDGFLVCYHDPLPVKTFKECMDYKIVPFVDVLRFCENTYFCVDIKDKGLKGMMAASELFRILQLYNGLRRTIVCSFHNDVIKYIRLFSKSTLWNEKQKPITGFTKNEVIKFWLFRNLMKYEGDVLVVPNWLAKKNFIHSAQKLNIPVVVYTINNKNKLKYVNVVNGFIGD